MDYNTINRIWKRTPTPEVNVLFAQLVMDATKKGYELDQEIISEMVFQAFKVGFEAGRTTSQVITSPPSAA